MLDFLAGVPGKLQTLLTRLSSARATALDYLDAAVTSRAAAATALSTAQWTNTRAGLVDNLDAAVTSRLSSVVVQTGFASSAGWSSSTGEDATYKDVTITAVVVAKSFVIVQPLDTWATSATGRLTSTTNLRVCCQGAGVNQLRWYVVEIK